MTESVVRARILIVAPLPRLSICEGVSTKIGEWEVRPMAEWFLYDVSSTLS